MRHGVHAGTHRTAAALLAFHSGLSLSQGQTVLGILYDHEGVALMDILEFVEAHFLDEALDTSVHGNEVAVHHGIVGVLVIADVYEPAAHIHHAKD